MNEQIQKTESRKFHLLYLYIYFYSESREKKGFAKLKYDGQYKADIERFQEVKRRMASLYIDSLDNILYYFVAHRYFISIFLFLQQLR